MRVNVHSHLPHCGKIVAKREHRGDVARIGSWQPALPKVSPMRRANVQAHSDRRAEILSAAQRCFVRAGFHGASMQDICAEAGMSPGNLYRYFPSKEALIAGIAERDRAEVAQEFASADLSHGLLNVLEGMVRHYFAERPSEQVLLCTEVMAEARRNPQIARISA